MHLNTPITLSFSLNPNGTIYVTDSDNNVICDSATLDWVSDYIANHIIADKTS